MDQDMDKPSCASLAAPISCFDVNDEEPGHGIPNGSTAEDVWGNGSLYLELLLLARQDFLLIFDDIEPCLRDFPRDCLRGHNDYLVKRNKKVADFLLPHVRYRPSN
jgi:hypothetical protein